MKCCDINLRLRAVVRVVSNIFAGFCPSIFRRIEAFEISQVHSLPVFPDLSRPFFGIIGPENASRTASVCLAHAHVPRIFLRGGVPYVFNPVIGFDMIDVVQVPNRPLPILKKINNPMCHKSSAHKYSGKVSSSCTSKRLLAGKLSIKYSPLSLSWLNIGSFWQKKHAACSTDVRNRMLEFGKCWCGLFVHFVKPLFIFGSSPRLLRITQNNTGMIEAASR